MLNNVKIQTVIYSMTQRNYSTQNNLDTIVTPYLIFSC